MTTGFRCMKGWMTRIDSAGSPSRGLGRQKQMMVKWRSMAYFKLRRRFATALLPRLFDKRPIAHHKGATSWVRTGYQRYPALCHCQLGQDIILHDQNISLKQKRMMAKPLSRANPISQDEKFRFRRKCFEGRRRAAHQSRARRPGPPAPADLPGLDA